jgi:dipeptidyl-peptidase-3
MKKLIPTGLALTAALWMTACNSGKKEQEKPIQQAEQAFEVEAERFADIQVLRYRVPGFEKLNLQQKKLAYYLYQAALSGRDIIYDQKYRHNLLARKVLETIYTAYKGDKNDPEYKHFDTFIKQVWFANGLHHHYANAKFKPEFSKEWFEKQLAAIPAEALPMPSDEIKNILMPVFFDAAIDARVVDQSEGIDNIKASANNFYEGLTQKEVENFYAGMKKIGDKNAPMYGLNSKLVKENGKPVEKTWKVGGMYDAAISKIVYWLEKASGVAENASQKESIDKLVTYYKSGDLKDFDAYNIAWVKDTASVIDVVNGFIEVYGDAIGKRGSYESVVSMKDFEATKTIAAIAKEAQWFEDNSPITAEHKKKNVKGITAKVITVIAEAGDAAPSTPVGINLPNSNWIREQHGSKSVSLGNIVESYNIVAGKSPLLKEFAFSQEIIDRAAKHGSLAGALHTDMHEVIGHASGKINDGVGTPDVTLKNYANCLEEARADLVALYFIMDKKLIDIGVMSTLDVGKAEYDNYMMNGLITQITRLKLGDNLEEAHMRNRQLVAKWAFEKGQKEKVAEFVKKDGKTYVQINDYDKLRVLFGELLREIQRIKSEGDYKAATALVEGYGVKVDPELHKEVLARFEKLNVAPYKGFIQPKLVPVMQGEEITDVKVEYPSNFAEQMLEYSREYGLLPLKN